MKLHSVALAFGCATAAITDHDKANAIKLRTYTYAKPFVNFGRLAFDRSRVHNIHRKLTSYKSRGAKSAIRKRPYMPRKGFWFGLRTAEPLNRQINQEIIKFSAEEKATRPTLPERFNLTEHGGAECTQLSSIVGNQGACGSCWAFSTTTVASMSLCYQTNGLVKKLISPQQMLTCAIPPGWNGCEGWMPFQAMQWLVQSDFWIHNTKNTHDGLLTGTGAADDMSNYFNQNLSGLFGRGYDNITDGMNGAEQFNSCQKYQFSGDYETHWNTTDQTGTCRKTCDDGTEHTSKIQAVGLKLNFVPWFKDISEFFDLDSGDMMIAPEYDNLKHYILANGPVTCTFPVFEDFMSYTAETMYIPGAPGIYRVLPGADWTGGGHAMVVIGWGRENGVDYWIARNSWSRAFGINGDVKIAFDNGIGFPGETYGVTFNCVGDHYLWDGTCLVLPEHDAGENDVQF